VIHWHPTRARPAVARLLAMACLSLAFVPAVRAQQEDPPPTEESQPAEEAQPEGEAAEGPPATERRPVTETVGGEGVEDPYRWLEGDNSDPEAMGRVTPEVATDPSTREAIRFGVGSALNLRKAFWDIMLSRAVDPSREA